MEEGGGEYAGQGDEGGACVEPEALSLDQVELAACSLVLFKERDAIVRAREPDPVPRPPRPAPTTIADRTDWRVGGVFMRDK